MRKRFFTGCVLLLLCASMMAGCGKGTQENTGSGAGSVAFQEDVGAGSGQGLDSPDFSEADQAQEDAGVPDGQEAAASEEPAATPQKKTGPERNDYQDYKRQVRVRGLKSYKKLKSKLYTDKAEKGKVYLVLFLEITNTWNEKLFFNPYQLEAAVDGEEIENSVLFNDPEGYPTIFTNVEADSGAAGFVAWLVPKNWKELRLKYTGFEPDGAADMEMDFTKKDLREPTKYYNTLYYGN